MREICLDTETTGLDPRSGHRIVEVACIELVDKVRTGRFFHKYVNPRRDMPQEAFNVHGLSEEFLADKPIFDHIAQEFMDFIEGGTLVIHNAAFDLKFLNYELGLVGKDPLKKEEVIDSLSMARKKFPGSPASLDALCRRFNVDLSRRTKHGALLDTELLCDVYIELIGGAQEGLNFGANGEEEDASDMVVDLSEFKNKDVIQSRNFKLDEKDLKAHEEFIKENIKDNLWYQVPS